MGLDLKTHALDGKGGAGAPQAEDDALKASQTGDVEELKKLLDAGGGSKRTELLDSTQDDSFTFLERNIQGLDTLDRDSFHSVVSVEQEIATANLDDIEVDSRDSWESNASRDSLQLFNERREVRWTRHFSKATIDDSHVLKPAVDQDLEEDEEDRSILEYCKLLRVHVRQAWPLFISGFHLKMKSSSLLKETGKFQILAKLIGSKSKVLLDEDITLPKERNESSMKFTDPLLIEVPSSSTILQLAIKRVCRKKNMFRSANLKMENLGYVYIKVKDILQEDNHRIHDFFTVQKGIQAQLFCSVSLMSPYMSYITLLQLGSQNEKLEFGHDSNHYRKIQNEEAEEVFTFGRVKYSRATGVVQRSGCSDRNIKDAIGCIDEIEVDWLDKKKHQHRMVDIILLKMNNREMEVKELVALIFNYVDDAGKHCSQVVYRQFFDLEAERKEGEKIKMQWTKFARIRLKQIGKLRNTLKKCRLESTAAFDFVNESDIDIGIEMKKPDVWNRKDMDSMPHIVGSWVLTEQGAKLDPILAGHDDRKTKMKKTEKRKNTVIARAEVYIHYLKGKKSFLGCHGSGEYIDKYIYRGFKLMIQKSYVTKVPAFVALVIALKECELHDCL